MALPFPRRIVNKDHEFAERLLLEENLLNQIDSVVGHLRYEQYTTQFPETSSCLKKKLRRAALPSIPSTPPVDNRLSMHDLSGANYCRALREKLKHQEMEFH
jgi:hypothetical protein